MNRHRRIRRSIRRYAPLLPPAALALGYAVWALRPAPETHAECLRRLPGLVESELTGGADKPEFLSVKRHLLICANCAKMYIDLLEIADLDAQGELPRPSQVPPPDLSFLDLPDG
jgi:hypothetical protein